MAKRGGWRSKAGSGSGTEQKKPLCRGSKESRRRSSKPVTSGSMLQEVGGNTGRKEIEW